MKKRRRTLKRHKKEDDNRVLIIYYMLVSLSLSFPINHTFLFSLSPLAPRERKRGGLYLLQKLRGVEKEREVWQHPLPPTSS